MYEFKPYLVASNPHSSKMLKSYSRLGDSNSSQTINEKINPYDSVSEFAFYGLENKVTSNRHLSNRYSGTSLGKENMTSLQNLIDQSKFKVTSKMVLKRQASVTKHQDRISIVREELK